MTATRISSHQQHHHQRHSQRQQPPGSLFVFLLFLVLWCVSLFLTLSDVERQTSREVIWDYWLWFERTIETVVVPVYTVTVILYLTLGVAFRKQVEPLARSLYRAYASLWSRTTKTMNTTSTLKQLPLDSFETDEGDQDVPEEEEEDEDEEEDDEIRRQNSLVGAVTSSKEELEEPESAGDAAAATASGIVDDKYDENYQPINFTGSYKLISNENFESFLAVQGVPWALRRAANQARPIHHITHQGRRLTIRIESIIESETTYTIGGPAVETNVRGRIFQDKVSYVQLADDRYAVLCRKTGITEQYDCTVQRELSEDHKFIYMTSTAYFRDGREPVISKQVFERISPLAPQ